MLQIEAEREPEPKEPAGASCSPAALSERTDCAAPASTTTTTTTTTTTASNKQETTCTGPDCMVAPMPGEFGAPVRPAGDSSAMQAPQTRPVSYGPMTSAAFDRMVAKKRAAVRAKMEAAGGMHGVLKTFMEVRADPFKEVAAQKVPRHAADDAGIPLPTPSSGSGAGASKQDKPQPQPRPVVKADFEMRFAAEAPPMAPINDEEAVLADEAAARSHTPAAAGRAWGTSEANLKKQVQQQAAEQQQQVPNGPGRPPMTEEEAAKLAAQAAAREAGLGRKKLAAQAGRPVNRQAALSAAMQAKQSAKPTALPTRTVTGASSNQQQQQQGQPMRGAAMTTSPNAVPVKQQGADYKTIPAASRSGFAGRGPREPRIEVEVHTMPGASRPASELPDAERVPESLLRSKPQSEAAAATDAAAAAAQPHVRSDIERVLLLEPQAQARPQPQPAAEAAAVVTETPKEPAPTKPMRKPSARMSAAAYKLQQLIRADEVAQARSWAAFDYACAALLLMVAPVAVFLAAALLEDMFLKSPSSSSASCAAAAFSSSAATASAATSWTEVPAHWAELTASLWRRTRRAAVAAVKSLGALGAAGAADQLPLCSHADAAATSYATGVADATLRRRH
ncbi:hypothetical protein HYH02_009848 [Chlamydomonas schloesseri]|uniref:Uncharacterized protein n=1 Tax=Chlamydomonas schloesseri TaxID=2026947 RepID=A0A835TAR9_9CHLO|nr:hypothetical protein HYH02_009848 [Chlamydomonas schloesseri]|eukprot:KAG2442057.1 hypothetical protein HYH02_009848 [Chlamydomonas schloesseri]